jgi:glycosyltransferase involved in cell wall biosynthesis
MTLARERSDTMRIGLIAPPFIAVPPARYGGTELFLAHLADGLHARGHDVTVYANGESCVKGELKWRYPRTDWPIREPATAQLKNLDHTGWSLCDAAATVDVLHLNDIVGVPFTPLLPAPVVLTLHHPHEPALSEIYAKYPDVRYVAISEAQKRGEPMRSIEVVHHGIPLEQYVFGSAKDDYVVFLGRMAPCKGAHFAIEAARRAGVRLKLAGEVQPVFAEYWERQVLPHVDGDRVEFVGEADLAKKNDLLSRARALLFPVDWDEPFGLIMIEAMACGTPVLAFDRGSVGEVVRDGVSGWICGGVTEMADRLRRLAIRAESCRAWVAERFTCERMVARYVDVYERALLHASERERPASFAAEGAWKT